MSMLESLPSHHQPLINWVLENTLNWAEVPPPVPTHPFVTTLIKHLVTQAPRTLASPPRWSHSGRPAAWFVSCDIAGDDAHPSGQRLLGNAEVNAGGGGGGEERILKSTEEGNKIQHDGFFIKALGNSSESVRVTISVIIKVLLTTI